jgi:leucyl aminopeptidase
MTIGDKSTSVDVYTGDPHGLDADLVVLPVFEGETTGLEPWSQATKGELERAIGSKEFCGKLYEFFVTPLSDRSYRASRFAAIGVGPAADFTIDRARRAATAAGLAARQRKISRMAFIAERRFDAPEMLQAVTEGLKLAEFDAGRYKTVAYEAFELRTLTIAVSKASAELTNAVERGRVLGDCCNMARELANEPGNALTPSVFADRAAAIAREGGLSVDVLDEHQLEKLGTRAGRRSRATRSWPGRQRDYVRHRRHLHQAGGRYGADER